MRAAGRLETSARRGYPKRSEEEYRTGLVCPSHLKVWLFQVESQLHKCVQYENRGN
jgi:hypothetical protein